MSEKGKKILLSVISFLLGAAIMAVVAFVILPQPAPSSQQQTAAVEKSADSETAALPEADGSETAALPEESGEAEAVSSAGNGVDYENTFPSWNPESASLTALVAFVKDAANESSPNYIDPSDRIAVFDMDGTIICEKAPVYFDYCLTMYRVLDDETYDASELERAAMQVIRDYAYTNGETYKPAYITKDDVMPKAFAGMSPDEFRAYTTNFADTVEAVGFKGMTYGESFYRPMIEVINFLRANGFDVWMVSACEREVVRAVVERIGIPADHVVATDVPYVASGKPVGEAADAYNMSQDEIILLGEPLDAVECGKSGKPAAIAREIGKRPVLAFGNSTGDYSMLNYAKGNPKHPGMGFFIVCDDTEREYGSDEKAAGFYSEAEKQGWTPVSMKNDWKTIYGEGVEKTQLPGAVTEEQEVQPEQEIQEEPAEQKEQEEAKEEQPEQQEQQEVKEEPVEQQEAGEDQPEQQEQQEEQVDEEEEQADAA